MNIIFLEAVQSHGGARKSTIELAKRLHSNGHNSMIVDFWGNCSEFIDEVNECQIPLRVLVARKSPIAIFKSRNPFLILKNLGEFVINWNRLRNEFSKLTKEFNADIVIVNNIKTNSILRRGSSYKIVYFARGWFALNSIGLIKKLLFKYNSDYFIGVSQSTRQAIYTGGLAPLDKIFVVPNAIDVKKVDRFKNLRIEKRDDSLTILHCGGFLPSKGQDVSILLAKKLLENQVPFKMILMGAIYDSPTSTDYLSKIKKQISDWNLTSNIEVVLNQREPYEIFKDADILIHPSESEGLPRVIMEAFAFGMPVVANPVGGVTDFVLHNFTGFITDHNFVDDYYEAVVKLHEDRKYMKRLATNARFLIEANYYPERQIECFENVLRKFRI